MDTAFIMRCLLLAVYLPLVASVSDIWLKRSIREAANRERRTHRENRIELNSIKKVKGGKNVNSDSCCFNGGICIMNSFCHCQKRFYGRHCEHKQHHRPCGSITHGTWMAAGCHLCHCFDGRIDCKVSKIPGCKHVTYTEGQQEDPDYKVGVDTEFDIYDKFYEDEEEFTTSSNGAEVVVRTTAIVCLIVVTQFVKKFIS